MTAQAQIAPHHAFVGTPAPSTPAATTPGPSLARRLWHLLTGLVLEETPPSPVAVTFRHAYGTTMVPLFGGR